MSHDNKAHSEVIVSLDEMLPGTKHENLEDAGQSGDTQGLSESDDVANETVKKLVEEDQPYEAGVVEGVEVAGEHPERPVRSHEDRRPAHESELPAAPDWK